MLASEVQLTLWSNQKHIIWADLTLGLWKVHCYALTKLSIVKINWIWFDWNEPATVAGKLIQFTRQHTNSPTFGWWRVLISIPGTHTLWQWQWSRREYIRSWPECVTDCIHVNNAIIVLFVDLLGTGRDHSLIMVVDITHLDTRTVPISLLEAVTWTGMTCLVKPVWGGSVRKWFSTGAYVD